MDASKTPSSRLEKLQLIVEAWGALDQIDAQLLAARDLTARQCRDYADALLAQLEPWIEPTIKRNVETAFNEFAKALSDILEPTTLLEALAEGYGSNLSDDDLDAILEHHRSELGRKMVAAEKDAIARVTALAIRLQEADIPRVRMIFERRVNDILRDA